MIKGDVQKRRDEHRNKVKKDKIRDRARSEGQLRARLSGAGRLRNQRMINRPPMLGRDIGVTGGPEQRRGQEKQNNNCRAGKNSNRKDKQEFIFRDN